MGKNLLKGWVPGDIVYQLISKDVIETGVTETEVKSKEILESDIDEIEDFNNNNDFYEDPFTSKDFKNTAFYDIDSGKLLGLIEGADLALATIETDFFKLKGDELNELAKRLTNSKVNLGKRTEFELLAATLYAEGSINNDIEEYLGIASAIRNRFLNPPKIFRNKISSFTNVIQFKKSRIDGYHDRNKKFNPFYLAARKRDISDKQHYSLSRHLTATKAALLIVVDTNEETYTDYSDGAYFWGSQNINLDENYIFIKRIPKTGSKYTKFWKLNPLSKVRLPW